MRVRLVGEDSVRVTPHAPSVNVPDHWRERAACVGMTWMTEPGRVREARKVCEGCPVLEECRQWALDPSTPLVLGVVAGLTLNQRGWVGCDGCGDIMRRNHGRNGRCFRCYVPGSGPGPGRPKATK